MLESDVSEQFVVESLGALAVSLGVGEIAAASVTSESILGRDAASIQGISVKFGNDEFVDGGQLVDEDIRVFSGAAPVFDEYLSLDASVVPHQVEVDIGRTHGPPSDRCYSRCSRASLAVTVTPRRLVKGTPPPEHCTGASWRFTSSDCRPARMEL